MSNNFDKIDKRHRFECLVESPIEVSGTRHEIGERIKLSPDQLKNLDKEITLTYEAKKQIKELSGGDK